MRLFKPAFHDAYTDTDILADVYRRENVGMSFSLTLEQLQEIARVGRVSEDPREDVGVVECGLF